MVAPHRSSSGIGAAQRRWSLTDDSYFERPVKHLTAPAPLPKREVKMKTNPINLAKLAESTEAERIAERLDGELSDAEEKVWGGDFAASGDDKRPAPPIPLPQGPGQN